MKYPLFVPKQTPGKRSPQVFLSATTCLELLTIFKDDTWKKEVRKTATVFTVLDVLQILIFHPPGQEPVGEVLSHSPDEDARPQGS